MAFLGPDDEVFGAGLDDFTVGAEAAEARKENSVKAVFDRLHRKDDPKRPICGTESKKGVLLVYRHLTATSRKLERLKEAGVSFGKNFWFRVVNASFEDKLPAFARDAYQFGDAGEGRQIFRLLKKPKPQEK